MAKRKKPVEPTIAPTDSEMVAPRPKTRRPSRRTEAAAPEIVVELADEPLPVLHEDLAEFETRTSVRRPLKVPAVVQFKESAEESWKEMTQISTVSKNGAALVLSRECPVGRLISLVLQMPQDLRVYDHYAPVYPILGVVQNCYASTVGDTPVYHVGVAFIGKKVPAAAKNDPKQCYRITGQNRDGLWEVVETGKAFRSRKHSRLWRRFEVTVAIRDEQQRTSRREQVFTRDVSAGGMCVWGPLDAEIGDRVKVASKEHDFYTMATVRNRTDDEKDESNSLVHFEFEGAEFPVSKIAAADANPKPVKADEPPAETDPSEHDHQLYVPGVKSGALDQDIAA